jgi:glycosyltransferase involved in cell wall biosynthesis
MNVIFFTRYSYEAASSRYRFYQYVDPLMVEGINVIIYPLFDDKYVKNLTKNGNRQYLKIISSYLKRIKNISKEQKCDLVFIEKELFPWIPYGVVSLLAWYNIPYIVDYDDAVFHYYDLRSNFFIKYFLGQKIDKVMSNAEIVTVGSPYLASKAAQVGSKRIEILPTVIDLDKYEVSRQSPKQIFTIGWIGSPSTTRYLQDLVPVFQSICAHKNANVVAIGAKDFQIDGVDLQIKQWSEEQEVNELQNIDVGIMPLDDTPWSRGKCGFKLIQYMACSKPVIASPVGVNTEIVEHGVNGFLASTNAEWIEYLQILQKDPELRENMGKQGRIKVERQYCLQVTAPKLAALFRSVVQGK